MASLKILAEVKDRMLRTQHSRAHHKYSHVAVIDDDNAELRMDELEWMDRDAAVDKVVHAVVADGKEGLGMMRSWTEVVIASKQEK